MLSRKMIVFIMVGFFTCFSVFGQNVATVKEFERARRTMPIAISFNLFGFGIGSFLQGDTKGALMQLGISTVGYAFLLPGIFSDFIANDNYSPENLKAANSAKNTFIGIGSVIVAGNAVFGTIRSSLYQFDKKFDEFYNINNEARWPAGGN